MNHIYYGYTNIEWPVHHEDDGFYYYYEVVERELFTWKFPKKDCKIVGSSSYRCMECGKRFGSNGCKKCSPYIQWWDQKWWYPTITEEGKEKSDAWWAQNHILDSRVNEQNKKGNYWHQQEWGQSLSNRGITQYYLCHRCKYFNFHAINYCYKCGQRLVTEKMNGQELREKYKHYNSGF